MKYLTEFWGIKLESKPEILQIKDGKYAIVNWKNLTNKDKYKITRKTYGYWSKFIADTIMFGLSIKWDSDYSAVSLDEIKYEEV